ncbi:hypothetical protein [Protofrankia symbiont of Coriaria ruscifolia]|uniref:hypothetical protein n=1 Tax=Protofrankia symbiont of Coriaria ruscifolia TaxID=1306542 RepID=UPI001A94C8DE|nr:hypothetical protein [Protofrankia symbiont of Coriaria ruscifolia]
MAGTDQQSEPVTDPASAPHTPGGAPGQAGRSGRTGPADDDAVEPPAVAQTPPRDPIRDPDIDPAPPAAAFWSGRGGFGRRFQ